MPRYTIDIQKGTPLHDSLKKRIESRVRLAIEEQQTKHQKWREAEERTLAYLPESEADAMRRVKRQSLGAPQYTTIQIPYSYGILMSAHTYWTSVFFARNPVHQFMGRHGEGEQQTQALEALIGYQVEVGEFMGPYYIWLYDMGKYGLGVLGEYWDRRKLHIGSLVEMPGPNGNVELFQTTQELPGYVGNCIYNISPWDFLPDPRVPVKRFQDGEFVAYRCRMGWNRVVERMDAGYYIPEQVASLKNKQPVDRARSDASSILYRPMFDKQLYGDREDANAQHPAGVIAYEFYASIIPKEWGVGGTGYPQKWCFTINDELDTILGATPLPNYHARFPFTVGESEVEGYGLYSRGIVEIMEPVQNTVDWLLNTHFFNVRAALNNQFIVDPSKLVVKDVQNSGPGFVWRLRPEAYGSDISKIFMQVPIQDITRSHLADFQTMLGIGERTLGINDQIMGTLNTGSARKTATEVRTTTGFGVNRQKTITEYVSATAFAPHAQRLVQNSQQFYDVQAKLRRVGNLALEAGERFVNVSPDDIVGFYDYVPVDGTMPIDRMAQANLWKELVGSLRMMPPQVAGSYDWTRIFAWVAQLAGLKNINQFKIQMAPDAMLQQQAQQGNVIPLRGGGAAGPGPSLAPVTPGNAASTAAGLNALPGMGGEGG